MLTLALTKESGARNVKFPLPWDQVTLGQYARMQGKNQLEQVAILAGVEYSEIQALDDTDKAILMMVMDNMPPMVQKDLADFPGNIGLESIGQFELAKKFIQQFQDEDEEVLLWDVAPYILAIYLWPDEYDLKAGFYAGFPVPLVERAKAMPITECIGAIVFFSANCPGLRQALRMCSVESPMPMKQRPMWSDSRSTAFSAA